MEPWIPFCMKEIDTAVSRGKRLTDWELDFLKTVKHRVGASLGLTPKQVDRLQKLHQRMTEVKRLKW